MRKLTKVLKAIGRFVNRAIIEMAANRPGSGMATRQERVNRQEWEENLPPEVRKDLGIKADDATTHASTRRTAQHRPNADHDH